MFVCYRGKNLWKYQSVRLLLNICMYAERFQAAERSDWKTTSDQTDNMTELQHMQALWTTKDVSVQVHEGFR